MAWAAGIAGWPVTWTYGGLYRTFRQQQALFHQRWGSVPLVGRPRVFYAGGWWWLKPGVARAAVPGTSNHGWGLAVDLAMGDHPSNAVPITPVLPWLIANADAYSFTWEDQTEPWHVRYVSGDQIPEKTLEWEAWLSSQ